MKKEIAKAQKKEVKPTTKLKRQPAKRSTSKQAKAATAVAEVPETIEQPAEQQATHTTTAVTTPPESAILQNDADQAEVAAVSESTDSAVITEQPSEPQSADTVTATIPKESKVLRERLRLNGYITETVKLLSSIEILGSKAEGVVFAKEIAGIDRVLLHATMSLSNSLTSLFSDTERHRRISVHSQVV